MLRDDLGLAMRCADTQDRFAQPHRIKSPPPSSSRPRRVSREKRLETARAFVVVQRLNQCRRMTGPKISHKSAKKKAMVIRLTVKDDWQRFEKTLRNLAPFTTHVAFAECGNGTRIGGRSRQSLHGAPGFPQISPQKQKRSIWVAQDRNLTTA